MDEEAARAEETCCGRDMADSFEGLAPERKGWGRACPSCRRGASLLVREGGAPQAGALAIRVATGFSPTVDRPGQCPLGILCRALGTRPRPLP